MMKIQKQWIEFIMKITNEKLYQLWLRGEARVITITQKIDLEKSIGYSIHKLLIEYKNNQYWIKIKNEEHKIINPNQNIIAISDKIK